MTTKRARVEGNIVDDKGKLTAAYRYEVAQRIFSERIRTGLNQKDFAKKVGISNQTFNNLENGKGSLKLEFLYQIAKACGCDISYLLGDTENRTYIATDICKETGLSEEAVNILKNEKESWEDLQEAKNNPDYHTTPVLFYNPTSFVDYLILNLEEMMDIIEEIKQIESDVENYRGSIVYDLLLEAYHHRDGMFNKFSMGDNYTIFPSDYFKQECETLFYFFYSYGTYNKDEIGALLSAKEKPTLSIEKQRELFKQVLDNHFLEINYHTLLEGEKDADTTAREFAKASAEVFNHFHQTMKDYENLDYYKYKLAKCFESLVTGFVEGDSNGK